MNLFMIALAVFIVVLAALVVFQIALACGAPLGRFAWGGQYERVLPRKLRIASVLSIVVYVFMAVVALDRIGVTSLFPAAFSRIAMWFIFGYLVLGVIMNLFSRSKPERYTMTPVALVLALSALALALAPVLAPNSTETFNGVVIDHGDGAMLCTGAVAESDPPQCGPEVVPIDGWSWEAVEFVDRDPVKWGQYTFEAIDHGDRLELVGVRIAD